jgi:hypothetical protein
MLTYEDLYAHYLNLYEDLYAHYLSLSCGILTKEIIQDSYTTCGPPY